MVDACDNVAVDNVSIHQRVTVYPIPPACDCFPVPQGWLWNKLLLPGFRAAPAITAICTARAALRWKPILLLVDDVVGDVGRHFFVVRKFHHESALSASLVADIR